MTKEKNCENCGKAMNKKAVVCTSCGAKGLIHQKRWLGLMAIVAVLVLAVSGCNSFETPNNSESENTPVSQTESIEYEVYTVSELIDDLEGNALKAEEKYKDKYVEITGNLRNIDSDGKYIDLSPTNNEFSFIGVQCYIKNDEQKSQVMELSKGDTVTVKGKIKSIGEVLGYSLDIDAIN